jgi:hypothetical protein
MSVADDVSVGPWNSAAKDRSIPKRRDPGAGRDLGRGSLVSGPYRCWWVDRQDWTKSALLGVPSLFGELQYATQEYCEPGFDGSLPPDGVPFPAGSEGVVTLVGPAGLLPGGADGGDSGTGTEGGVVSPSQASV